MNNRRAILLAAALVIVIGVIVVWTLRSLAPKQPPAVATATAAPQAPATVSTADSPATKRDDSHSEPPPPWMQAPPTAVAAPATSAAATVDPVRQQQLKQLESAVQGIVADATVRVGQSSKNMYKALDALQAMNDPAVTSQINLKAVRHNLDISMQMQAAATELLRLMQQPKTTENNRKMDALMADIRQLQTRMIADVRAKGSKLPPLTPATATGAGN